MCFVLVSVQGLAHGGQQLQTVLGLSLAAHAQRSMQSYPLLLRNERYGVSVGLCFGGDSRDVTLARNHFGRPLASIVHTKRKATHVKQHLVGRF